MNLLGESGAKDLDIEVLDLGKRARDEEALGRKPCHLKKRITIVDLPMAKEVEMVKSFANP